MNARAPPEDPRALARAAFCAGAGWGDADERPFAADASFRRYFRLRRGAGPSPSETALVMDAPPPMEDVRPFARLAAHLRGLGLRAPAILARDEAAGFLLLEDFGDDTYTRLLDAGAPAAPLYELAVDVLATLQDHPRATATAVALAPYDTGTLLAEAALLADWYYPELAGHPCPAPRRAAWLDAWREVIEALPAVPATLVLRDYHVDNLMRLPGATGVAACGLLDFQDALAGPAAYDLVSLLEDARRDVAPDLAARLRERYFARRGPGAGSAARAAFDTWYAALGAQRHAKVAGIFVRLWRRDGKHAYLRHLPRVTRLLAAKLDSCPALAPVRGWLEQALPGFAAPPASLHRG